MNKIETPFLSVHVLLLDMHACCQIYCMCYFVIDYNVVKILS